MRTFFSLIGYIRVGNRAQRGHVCADVAIRVGRNLLEARPSTVPLRALGTSWCASRCVSAPSLHKLTVHLLGLPCSSTSHHLVRYFSRCTPCFVRPRPWNSTEPSARRLRPTAIHSCSRHSTASQQLVSRARRSKLSRSRACSSRTIRASSGNTAMHPHGHSKSQTLVEHPVRTRFE